MNGEKVTSEKFKKTPPRLQYVFQKYDLPLYYVTVNTYQRRKILDNEDIYRSFIEYGKKNADKGRAIGRFVVMPDHLHLFLRIGREDKLGLFVGLMKQHLDKILKKREVGRPWWQQGFFDHLIRSSESYAQKIR